MRTLIAATLIWTVIASVLLLLDPGGGATLLPCMKLIARSAECEANQHALNDAFWFRHTLPLVIAALSGYAGITAIWLRRRGRPRI